MKRALLLNADYAPLHFVPDVEAFIMVYKDIAEIVQCDGRLSTWEGEELTSPGRTWPCPATIRLLKRVNKRWRTPRFRKKVLFNRDDWKCQYCHTELHWGNVTIDHVQPRSRGGGTNWKNCVTSCKPCNKRKAAKTLSEINMTLHKAPVEPSPVHFWDMSRNCWHDDWEMFLSL